MPAEHVDTSHDTHPTEPDDCLLVVDLFCGCGGFSCGAAQAGSKVVLAVDCDRAALAYHKANHKGCTHVKMTLGPDSEDRIVQLIQSVIPSGRKWHLHGSPPCQLFSPMRNLTKGKQPTNGMQLVEWYINFVQRMSPHTWTFENVRAPQIKSLMVERGITYGYFNFVKYGVPQTRKRCLAGTHTIIHTFKTDTSLLSVSPQSPTDVLTPPQNAVYIRASGGKCTEYFYRSVSEPTWALLCACKPVYAAHDRSCIRVMHIREMLRLQTFPESYRMKSSGHLGMLGSESDRVRLVGNAVPPLVALKLVSIATGL
jgi:site-specific DNA-cytosine methylase